MHLNICAIEKILFPLNKQVYFSIEKELNILSKSDVATLIKCFEFESNAFYEEKLEISQTISEFPEFNVYIFFPENEDITISTIEKSKNYKIWTSDLKYIKRENTHILPTSDLILRFYHKGIEQTFVVPLAYILGYNEKKINNSNYYQVYQHNVVPKDRAGITEDEAMEIEEKNVEKISLYPIFSKGLNMIPGGRAGLKFLHEHAKTIGYKIEKEIDADIFESEMIKMENFNLKQILKNKNSNFKNEKLAELWANDINFRISAITNQKHHFSYDQIQCARLLYASGWEIEKIFDNIKKIDTNKEINIRQLDDLLLGNTYSSIPYVIL